MVLHFIEKDFAVSVGKDLMSIQLSDVKVSQGCINNNDDDEKTILDVNHKMKRHEGGKNISTLMVKINKCC